jgi:hypothetical protein
MTDPFELLVQQLGVSLNVPLYIDKNHACALQVHGKLTVQLQLDAAQEYLLIAAFICELPPGKFRENVLCEALKTNAQPDPRTGVMGYLAISNRLTMHQRYLFATLKSDQLAMIVAGFIDYAELWQDAVGKGQSSPSPIRATVSTNVFGLKR